MFCRPSASSRKCSRPTPASRCSATARWWPRPWPSACCRSSVWLHHFFTMGAGADVNAVFGIMSMIIAVPTGVKVFNWMFTMYGGRVRYASPMYWGIGFVITFIIAGMTGVLLAVPPADFLLHNSLFLVAHFHNVIIGGDPVRRFRRLYLLVPQGLRLPPRRAPRQSGVLVLVRRLLSRLHAALRGRPHGHDAAHAALRQSGLASLAVGRCRRRRCHSGRHPPARLRSSSSASAIARNCATRPAIRGTAGRLNGRRRRRRPPFNFAVLPHVEGTDAYWLMKQRAIERGAPEPEPVYQDIELPRNSATGFVCAFFAAVPGLRPHLADLVARGSRLRRRLRHVRGLRLARPHRVSHSGRGGGAHRPREPRRPPLGARPDGACRMSIAARTTAVGLGGEGAAGAPSVPHQLSELAREAHHRRLRLLDLPPQRHHYVFGVLRRLCRLGERDGRRPERPGSVSSRHRRVRDRLPPAVELRLRRGHHWRARASRRACTMARWR